MRALKNMSEVTVIGGGLAGLSAARHAARLGRLVTLFEGSALFGGQVATIGEVDGMPVPGKFSGQDVAIYLLDEARKAGVQLVSAGIATLQLDARITVIDTDRKTHHPSVVVIASGASARRLGVPGEQEFIGRGVSHCATCDGGFFRGQDVVVVGGGDGAVHEALVLAKTSRRVFMVSRSPLKAKREYIDKVASRENVSFLWNTEVTAIEGIDGVSVVRLRNVKDGVTSDLECSGVFPFIGATPNSEFAPATLLTATGHIGTGDGLATRDPRVFAAGAVRANYGGNVVQAMAEGVGAAEAAVQLLLH